MHVCQTEAAYETFFAELNKLPDCVGFSASGVKGKVEQSFSSVGGSRQGSQIFGSCCFIFEIHICSFFDQLPGEKRMALLPQDQSCPGG